MMGLKPTRGDIRVNGDDDEKTFARVRKNMYVENGHKTWWFFGNLNLLDNAALLKKY